MMTMRHLACGVVLLAVAACKRPPARLVVGIADTVVVNNVRPVRVPMQVLDAAGRVLPDTGVRYEWMSGLPIPVSNRGVVKCTQAGDAAVRASLGMLATSIVVRCRPVHKIRGGGELDLVVGDPPQDLLFAAVDASGRPVTPLATVISVSDSTVLALQGRRIRARASGLAHVDVYIGDEWTSYGVHVYERSPTLEGIRRGQHLAVPVRLAGGEMRRWELPGSPPLYHIVMLPDRDAHRTPRLAIEDANCQGDSLSQSYSCFALPDASVIVYHPPQTDPRRLWTGALAVWRYPCDRSVGRDLIGHCSSPARTP
jgi:hypothetical protein